jgi:Spy/CpxP family protein refolding chaperone
MKRTIPVLCAALLITGAALSVQAGSHMGGGRGGRMMHHGGDFGRGAGMPQQVVDRLTSELGLTKAQQESWKALRDKQKATIQPLFEAGRAKREAIHQGLDNNADAATLGQLLIDAHKIGEQIRAAHDQYEKSFTALLNSDQVAKYQEIRQKFHRGPGDGPPPEGD